MTRVVSLGRLASSFGLGPPGLVLVVEAAVAL
jgi:hypothetical protein